MKIEHFFVGILLVNGGLAPTLLESMGVDTSNTVDYVLLNLENWTSENDQNATKRSTGGILKWKYRASENDQSTTFGDNRANNEGIKNSSKKAITPISHYLRKNRFFAIRDKARAN